MIVGTSLVTTNDIMQTGYERCEGENCTFSYMLCYAIKTESSPVDTKDGYINMGRSPDLRLALNSAHDQTIAL